MGQAIISSILLAPASYAAWSGAGFVMTPEFRVAAICMVAGYLFGVNLLIGYWLLPRIRPDVVKMWFWASSAGFNLTLFVVYLCPWLLVSSLRGSSSPFVETGDGFSTWVMRVTWFSLVFCGIGSAVLANSHWRRWRKVRKMQAALILSPPSMP